MISGVYEIGVRGLDDSYVGSSKDIKRRCRQHLRSLRKGSHHCQALQLAYDIFGKRMQVRILHIASLDAYSRNPRCLIPIEQHFIDTLPGTRYNTSCSAYNPMLDPIIAARMGDTNRGKRHSWSRRRAVSLALKNKAFSASHLAAIRRYASKRVGVPLSAGHRRAISRGNTGKIISDKTCEKIGRALRGRKLSPSHVRNLRDSHLGYKQTPEHVANASNARARFNDGQVRFIRREFESGRQGYRELADKYRVCTRTIYLVVKHKEYYAD